MKKLTVLIIVLSVLLSCESISKKEPEVTWEESEKSKMRAMFRYNDYKLDVIGFLVYKDYKKQIDSVFEAVEKEIQYLNDLETVDSISNIESNLKQRKVYMYAHQYLINIDNSEFFKSEEQKENEALERLQKR